MADEFKLRAHEQEALRGATAGELTIIAAKRAGYSEKGVANLVASIFSAAR